MKKVLKGKSIKKLGTVEGEALVTTDLVAFWGGTDWETGDIVEVGHEAKGKNVKDKILVFPAGKGGAGDTFGYYYLARSGKAPKALICNRAQNTTIAGALLVDTPMIYGFKGDVVKLIKSGDRVRVNSDDGEIEIIRS
ncbi:MAG: aconitase X swivel domain-containing protein [Promethearchaeota archaeon]